MKRKDLSEIKTYLNRDKGYLGALNELHDLIDLFQESDNVKLFEFVPIKIVACMQEFFRDIYKDIIDNPKYRINLSKVKEFNDTKIDFEAIAAFQEQEVTMGDYLSYMVSCSKIETIDSIISNLMGIKFLGKVKEKDGGDELIASIDKIFKLRHMYCHEVPNAKEITYGEAIKMINDACDFLTLSNGIIFDEIYGEDFQTTADMIEYANKELESANKELETLISKIRSVKIEGELFNYDLGYIVSWKNYREERAKSESSDAEGGSIYPVLYTQSKVNTTKAFIKELKGNYKYVLKR